MRSRGQGTGGKVPSYVCKYQRLIKGVQRLINEYQRLIKGVQSLIKGVQSLINEYQRLIKGVQRLINEYQRLIKGVQSLIKGVQRLIKGVQRLISLVPSLKAGNVFPEVLPLVNKEEAEPPRMGSQPSGWEPVRDLYPMPKFNNLCAVKRILSAQNLLSLFPED
nr:hypothetical protein [Nostoc sp. DedQUE07]MDZ8132915.1 hypothetical protein [Nostoc sp. DedQUE07]